MEKNTHFNLSRGAAGRLNVVNGRTHTKTKKSKILAFRVQAHNWARLTYGMEDIEQRRRVAKGGKMPVRPTEMTLLCR